MTAGSYAASYLRSRPAKLLGGAMTVVRQPAFVVLRIDDQHRRIAEPLLQARLERRQRSQEHGTGKEVGDRVQHRRGRDCSVGKPDNYRPTVHVVLPEKGADGARQRWHSLREIRLVHPAVGIPPEEGVPARDLNRSAHPKSRGARRDLLRERHQIGLPAASAMQQDKRRALRRGPWREYADMPHLVYAATLPRSEDRAAGFARTTDHEVAVWSCARTGADHVLNLRSTADRAIAGPSAYEIPANRRSRESVGVRWA